MLSHEVSCLDICSFENGVENGVKNGVKNEIETNKTLVAVGLWMDISIKILVLPDFTELICEPLGEG